MEEMNHWQGSYPPIADYAFISDCHCTALVSRTGSVDWCCMPRVDSDSCFGRLLDWKEGGYCAISPTDANHVVTRRYLPDTMILETRFRTAEGEILLYDYFAISNDVNGQMRHDHVRIVQGVSGAMEVQIEMRPRFEFGKIIPRTRRHANGAYTTIGSNMGLMIDADCPLEVIRHCDLEARCRVSAGQRVRLLVHFESPELIDQAVVSRKLDAADIDAGFERTCAWWRNWIGGGRAREMTLDMQTVRSMLILKSLTYESTGAIIAAPTTSLPEAVGEGRNWDYRFSWVRDSVFMVRALYETGYEQEAKRFLQFIQRSSAGSAEQLQIMYAVDGKRRLTEIELGWLEGYRGSRPVRIGNHAATQIQLDVYGAILEIAWEWHANHHPIDRQYWSFLTDAVNAVCARWQEPDHGIWEFRSAPRHFVHSKAMCWGALEHGIRLARENRLRAPLDRWMRTRDAIRDAIQSAGFDSRRGVFIQAFNDNQLDAALLLLPRIGFIDYDDPRMIRTADAICKELDQDGLILRYKTADGLPGCEGVFIACTFWLAGCLASQGRRESAWTYYRRATECANDIGLLSEEFDIEQRQMLGNFPQGLTHVSQIMARLALDRMGG